MSRGGFVTRIEVLMVLIIALLLAAIAVPSLVRARRDRDTNDCISNQMTIESTLRQWAVEKGKGPDDAVTRQDLEPYFAAKNTAYPSCPLGGEYILTRVKDGPACPHFDAARHRVSLSNLPRDGGHDHGHTH